MTAPKLVEHFFRHEYARLVAVMVRRSGVRHITAIEDAAQSALMKALEAWKVAGTPDDPSAWLFRVAQNAFLDELRKSAGRNHLLQKIGVLDTAFSEESPPHFQGEMQDDLLRMLFVCCDEAIPAESQLVLALKTLCGFSVEEIASRLFTSEANVYKRLSRARSRLRSLEMSTEDLTSEQMASRLPGVNKVLYALFAEGYLSSGDFTIRRDLCEEALRLATILADHPVGKSPEVFALLALMHLHTARMTARQDGAGGLLLLEEQDRALWDKYRIELGLQWLALSAQGDRVSRYHAEAGVAAEHCLAPTFEATRWDKVVECYALLERVAPSAINRLNRAVAVAEWLDPAAALAELKPFEPPSWLGGSYLWAAVLADLHRRCGDLDQATIYRDSAIGLAPSKAIAELLQRRLEAVSSRGGGNL